MITALTGRITEPVIEEEHDDRGGAEQRERQRKAGEDSLLLVEVGRRKARHRTVQRGVAGPDVADGLERGRAS